MIFIWIILLSLIISKSIDVAAIASQREKDISYHLYVELKNKTNELIHKTEP